MREGWQGRQTTTTTYQHKSVAYANTTGGCGGGWYKQVYAMTVVFPFDNRGPQTCPLDFDRIPLLRRIFTPAKSLGGLLGDKLSLIEQ